MATKTEMKLAGLVGLGAALVITAVVWTRGQARPERERELVVAQADSPAGVAARAVDPAFARDGIDDGDGPTGAPILPAVAPVLDAQTEAEAQRAREAPPPPPPPPPLELSDEQLAANEAYLALQAEAAKQAGSALRGAHKKLRNACWDSKLGEATFTLNLSYASDGKLVASGLSEPRAAGLAGVGDCLRAQPLDLDISAPGQGVNVDVPLAFP